MSKHYAGSCLCQAVSYQIIGEFESFYLCHCQYCQKDTGSAHAANLFATEAKLIWLVGANNVKTFQLSGTRHVKSFCLTCGSALPTSQMGDKILVVPAGSLDVDAPIKPNAHIFCESQANWERTLDALPKFANFPS